jgi:hypothetical protein
LLLVFAVLASFAVAAGIVLESPHWSIANALVIGGVAIEAVCTLLLFGFDEGISGAQQAKIVTLETRLAFRSLSDEQFNDLIQQLKPSSGQHFDIVTYWKNPEAKAITGRIYDTLTKAGWIYDKPELAEFILGVETGVSVAFDKRNESAVKTSKVLIYALLTNDIYASEDPDSAARAFPDSVPISSKLTINVGIRP